MKKMNSSGMALTLTIIVMLLLTALAGYALNASMHQGRLRKQASLVRNKAYYWAQAGVVEAYSRIRTNYLYDYVNNPAPPNPASYCLDVDPNSPGDDVRVTIGAKDASGLRTIEAVGRGSDNWVGC